MALLVSDRGSLAADDREISGDCRQFRLNVRYKFTFLTNNSGAIRHIVKRIRTEKVFRALINSRPKEMLILT